MKYAIQRPFEDTAHQEEGRKYGGFGIVGYWTTNQSVQVGQAISPLDGESIKAQLMRGTVDDVGQVRRLKVEKDVDAILRLPSINISELVDEAGLDDAEKFTEQFFDSLKLKPL